MARTASGLYVPSGGVTEEAFQQLVTLPNPVARANLTYMVTGNFYEELINFKALFTTDAGVTQRAVVLAVLDNNGVEIALFPSAAGQPASKTYFYNYSPANTTPSVDTVTQAIAGPVPPILLIPGWSIAMEVSNTGVADVFTSGRVLVNRIPTGSSAPPEPELYPAPVSL